MQADSLRALGEFGLIHRLSERLTVRPGVQLGIGDDAAVLDGLHQPIITVDALVEGVHYRRDWMTATQLGFKAMTVNVSDIAAMGARPVAAFVALAVSPQDSLEFIDGLYSGFEEAARQFGFTVAGGDTVRTSGPGMISVTLTGEVFDAERGAVLRSGAQPGDVLLVSGTLGDSAAGLELLLRPELQVEQSERAVVLERHLRPQARTPEMVALIQANPLAIHAALDLSDGLAGDSRHMASRSGVSLEIDVERLPISEACREVAKVAGVNPIHWALSGGEDYELLLAVEPGSVESLVAAVYAATGTELRVVGRCVAGPGEVRLLENGCAYEARPGFTHF